MSRLTGIGSEAEQEREGGEGEEKREEKKKGEEGEGERGRRGEEGEERRGKKRWRTSAKKGEKILLPFQAPVVLKENGNIYIIHRHLGLHKTSFSHCKGVSFLTCRTVGTSSHKLLVNATFSMKRNILFCTTNNNTWKPSEVEKGLLNPRESRS